MQKGGLDRLVHIKLTILWNEIVRVQAKNSEQMTCNLSISSIAEKGQADCPCIYGVFKSLILKSDNWTSLYGKNQNMGKLFIRFTYQFATNATKSSISMIYSDN